LPACPDRSDDRLFPESFYLCKRHPGAIFLSMAVTISELSGRRFPNSKNRSKVTSELRQWNFEMISEELFVANEGDCLYLLYSKIEFYIIKL
jgi:hypothetical protein